MIAESASTFQVAEEEALRAYLYAMLGRFLRDVPEDDLLVEGSGLGGDTASQLGQALASLSRACAAAREDPVGVRDEFHALFIGMTRGELLPYASYYLTGFLNERPLANLRGDMQRLGIGRAEGIYESEDHIAALMEMMAGLIVGAFGDPADLDTQKLFFATHIQPWAPRFFEDLEAAKAAALYMPVGTVGRHFMEVEREAFEMAA